MSSWIFQQILWLIGIFSIVLLVPEREANANLPSGTRSKLQGDAICAVTDTSLFAAAVRWIKADLTASEKRKRPLRVDPRPLRPEVGEVMSLERYFAEVDSSARRRRRAIRQRLESMTLRERNFADVDSSILRRRRTVLRRLGVPQRNALTYSDDCLFACDPRLIKEEEADRIECPKKRCEVTVIALSLPVNSGTESHRIGQFQKTLTESDRTGQVQKTLRVFQLTAFTRFIHELTFQRSDSGWTMIEKNVVAGGGM